MWLRRVDSRLAKATGAEPAGQIRDEKLHAVVARSTFPSQNVQSTPGSDHFWKLRWWKSARRCGAKHISKSKCTAPGSDITTHFVGCKHGGHSKNVSNNFDPFVFFPDGEGYMYVRPPRSKTEPRKIYMWTGGRKSVIDTSPRTSPPFPPRTLRIGGRGGGKNVTVPDI